VFLAAIMVLSVFAVPLAFTGAAAAASAGDVTIDNQVTGEDAEYTFDFTTDGEEQNFSYISLTFDEAYDLDDVVDGDVTVTADGTPLGQDDVEVSEDNLIIINHTAQEDVPADVDISVTVEDIENPEADDYSVTLGLHDEEDNEPGEAHETLSYSYEITPLSIDDTTTDDEVANAYGVDRAFDANEIGGSLAWQGQEVAVYNLSANDDVQLRQVDDDRSRLRDELTTDPEGVVTFNTEDRSEGDYFLRGNAVENADLTNTGDSDRETEEFELSEQDLTAEFDDEEVAESGANSVTEIEFDSVRGSYALNVSADGDLDASELAGIFSAGDLVVDEEDDDEDRITLEAISDGEFEVDFDGIDEGDYEFTFEVIDSTASASASITVVDSGDGALSVEDADVVQGDIAEIVVSASNTDEGSIVIGDFDDVNYQINATIDFDDTDEVTVYLNTYTAGNQSDLERVIWLDDDDASITDRSEQGDLDGAILDLGDYEITVGATDDYSETMDNPDDVGSLFVEERTLEAINMWTASSDAVDDLLDEDEDDQAAFALTAIENDLITAADAIAHDDYAVHQLEATGLEGVLEDTKESEDLDSLGEALALLADQDNDDRALDLRIRETRDSVGPNANRRVVDLEETGLEVVHDDDGEQYFILINTDDVQFMNGHSLEKDDDYEVDVRFEIRDERLLDVDEDDLDGNELRDFFEEVSTGFEIVERDGAFDLNDEDLIEVEASSGQEITGSTNVAPGSEVQIRIRGTGDARFSKSLSEIIVDSDGTFAGEFDFSDRNVDDEFTATLRDVVTEDDNPEEDGLVVEAVEEAPEDDEDDVADDEDDVVDDEDDVIDDEDDAVDDEEVDDVDDETPGFGALVALVALLGAALLAARRQN